MSLDSQASFIYLLLGIVDMFPLIHDWLGNKNILLKNLNKVEMHFLLKGKFLHFPLDRFPNGIALK